MKTEEKKDFFFALQKTLECFLIGKNALPSNLEQWQNFLNQINLLFLDYEHERNLLERSIQIASAEFMELNEQFLRVEKIAHTGHWSYWSNIDRILWSKQTYKIFGIDEAATLPGYTGFMDFVLEEDRDSLKELVEKALTEGKEYETELRIYFQVDRSVRWIFISAKKLSINEELDPEKPYRYNLTGIVKDINQHKLDEEKLAQQLITISKQNGMSEVSASILHNIGNSLNGANVSIEIIREELNKSQIRKLEKVSKMILDGITKNPEFLVSDVKGKLIPDYLLQLSELLIKYENKIIIEVEELRNCIEHIKNILLCQSEISQVSAVREKISVGDICDQAIKMSFGFGENNAPIQIQKKFEFNNLIFIDKTKMLQILINLIRNAKESLLMDTRKNKKIIVLSSQVSMQKGYAEIQVSDNGVGIEKNNLEKIFQYGFTTKKYGHGFGLHISAIVAKEMGGQLTVKSEPEQGATFILKFPIK